MFKTYNASAGSGKTTSLVIEYLSLCFLNIERFRHILAITFTNNATAEMKERIITYLNLFAYTPLEQFTSAGDRNVYNKIAERCQHKLPELKEGERINSFMQERSQQLLEAILYDYGNFTISTIDSFFQRILRAFAHELDINMNFNLEISLDDLYTQAIDLLLNRISDKDKELTQRILSMVNKQMEENGRWRIEKSLKNILSENIYRESCYLPLKRLGEMERSDFMAACSRFKQQKREKKEASRKQAVDAALRGNEIVKSLGDAKTFRQGTRGLYGWFDKVLEKFPDITINSYIEKYIEEGSFTKQGEDAAYFEELCRLINLIAENCEIYIKYNLLGEQLESMMVLFDLKDIMDEIKSRDNLFYLSEANAKIYEEIEEDDTPFIYEKIGNKYSHFFIDEFQDTSKMQWDNLLPLVKNALASGGEATIFGDLKQAIYRFRGGDANLFASLSDQEAFQKQNLPTSFEMVSLDTNHRSARHIIEFNNGCFKELANEIPFYNETQKRDEENALTGFVSIRFKPHDAITGEYLNRSTLQMVQDALSRGFQYRDIAILTRGRQRGSELAQMLSAAGYPVISEDSLLLSASNEVTFIIHTLQYLNDPDDTMAQLAMLNYLRQQKGDQKSFREEIDMISDPNQHSFIKLLQKRFNIYIQPERLSSLPLFTLVKELINLFHLTDQYNAYLIRFMDMLLDYGQQQNGNITHFLNWWENQQNNISVVSSRDDNAITVTTIHKAKGLGYPVVIIPLNQYNEKGNVNHWYQPDGNECPLPYLLVKLDSRANLTESLRPLHEQETRATYIDNCNILYVAQTRAREALYIITGEKGKGNYAKLIDHYLGSVPKENLTQLNENDYLFGDSGYKHIAKEEKRTNEERFNQLHTSRFTPALLLPPATPLNEQQKQGLAIHDYLASLSQFPQNKQELEKMVIELNEEYIPMAREILLRILQDEQLRPYFQSGVKVLNEVTITDSRGQAHRPDRVVITDDEVMVIDYKTGRKQEKHQQQIDTYVNLLKEMGYANVRGQLLYID